MAKQAVMRPPAGPSILLLDIETFPNLYYAWRLWEGRALDIKKFSSIVCFSAKWLNGDQVTVSLPDVGNSEKRLVRYLWHLMDMADVVVAHNGKAFDFGRINSQFARFRFGPPSPAQRFDTKQVAKRVFGFDSNSLDNLCQFLDLGEKMETGGYELWKKCMSGDKTAWRRMKKYNTHDVVLLERLYMTLLPWSHMHPNVTLYDGLGKCPKCGSDNIQSRGGRYYHSATRSYRRFQCMKCKGWLRGVKSIAKANFTNTNV